MIVCIPHQKKKTNHTILHSLIMKYIPKFESQSYTRKYNHLKDNSSSLSLWNINSDNDK